MAACADMGQGGLEAGLDPQDAKQPDIRVLEIAPLSIAGSVNSGRIFQVVSSRTWILGLCWRADPVQAANHVKDRQSLLHQFR